MTTWIFNYRRYRLPFRTRVRTAHGEWREREGLIVRLEDAAGVAAYGEAATMPWFGTETVDEAEAACRAFGASVDETQIGAVPPKLACLRNALAAAVVAHFDLKVDAGSSPRPEAAGTPLLRWQTFEAKCVTTAGGAGSSERWSGLSLTRSIGVAALLPAGRAALAAAIPKAEAGFRVFKWKVGVGDFEEEMGLFDELCAAVPEGSKFRLDANGAWDRRRAERWLSRCAERPVEWVEQPISPTARGADDLLLGLATDYPTPVALDESLVAEGDVDRWLGTGWPGVYVVKPALLGDADGVLARLAKAKASVCFSSAFETGIGARTSLRAAFDWPGESRALGFGVWPLFEDARFNGPSATPFLRWADVERINPEAIWTALS